MKRVETALAAFAEVQTSRGELVTAADPELIHALRERFPNFAVAREPTDADLAQAAFELLAADSQHGPAIQALATGPQPEQFGVASTAAVVTICLVALQTHVRLKRTGTGKWQILIEKEPTDDRLLMSVVAKLMGRLALSESETHSPPALPASPEPDDNEDGETHV